MRTPKRLKKHLRLTAQGLIPNPMYRAGLPIVISYNSHAFMPYDPSKMVAFVYKRSLVNENL